MVVMVVMITYFYLMRKRERKLEADLKEKLRREVTGILGKIAWSWICSYNYNLCSN